MSKPKPLRILEIEEETDLEYNLRLAASFIETYARLSEAFHRDYDDDEPVTGREISEALEQLRIKLVEERQKNDKSLTIFGKIIQAGGIEDPSITISTTHGEIRGKPIPFYRSCEIRFTPSANQ